MLFEKSRQIQTESMIVQVILKNNINAVVKINYSILIDVKL
ncbi:MAG: hypothetical protein RL007_544 [Bacteroidota bacterium]|jgi:hypothetical protein